MKRITLVALCFLLLIGSLLALESPELVSVARYKGDKDCAISYTFDDGYKEHYTLVLPQLEKHGFKATFWVNGHSINKDESTTNDTTKMSWQNLKEMSDKGHEVSNHGWSHKKMTAISIEEARIEIEKNDSVIFEHTGVLPQTFCYPYNARNGEITRLASKGRVATRTKQFGIGSRNSKSTAEKLDQKVDELVKTKEWGVAMIHGITYEYDAFHNPSMLWNHWAKVKAMEDKIWVSTFLDVASYLKERDNIRLKIEGKKNKLTVTPVLSLDAVEYTQSLTAVINRKEIKKVSIKQNKKKLDAQIFPEKVVFDFDPLGGDIKIDLQ